MVWLAAVTAALALVILLIFRTKVQIELSYKRKDENDRLNIRISIWRGLIHYTVKMPELILTDSGTAIKAEEVKGNGPPKEKKLKAEELADGLEKMKDVLKRVRGLHRIIRRLLARTEVKQFEWETQIGTGDAASTGMLAGSILGMKGGLLGLLSTYFDFRVMPSYRVIPVFRGKAADTRIFCIFQVRAGHAITAGVRMIRHSGSGKPILKQKKETRSM